MMTESIADFHVYADINWCGTSGIYKGFPILTASKDANANGQHLVLKKSGLIVLADGSEKYLNVTNEPSVCDVRWQIGGDITWPVVTARILTKVKALDGKFTYATAATIKGMGAGTPDVQIVYAGGSDYCHFGNDGINDAFYVLSLQQTINAVLTDAIWLIMQAKIYTTT